MNPVTLHEAISRLEADYAFKKHKGGKWLQEGQCPSCRQKELYASAEAPWIIKCGRVNNCGWDAGLRDLYPDLFASWSDRFKSDNINPHAAADAYLKEGRGFDISKLKGSYSQDNYWSRELEIGSATVRFPLADGYWERIIDRPERFKAKARIKPGFSANGLWWCPPGVDLLRAPEIWLVEGIFDAIALWHHGIIAVAIISSNYYPGIALKALAEQCLAQNLTRPKLIVAMDNDPAGHKATDKIIKQLNASGWTGAAAQPPYRLDGKTQDWNDLHLKDKFTAKDIEDYRYYGALLTAATPTEKALLIYKHSERSSFTYEFRSNLYWFKLDIDAYNKKMAELRENRDGHDSDDELRDEALASTGGIQNLANCYPNPLYFQANEITGESWYYFRITSQHRETIKSTFTGTQLASASEFKKRLLSIAPGCLFTGNGQQLDDFIRYKVDRIRHVKTIDYIGYSHEYQTWIFNQIAVHNGKVYKLNSDDYYEIGKLDIKSLSQSPALDINPDLKTLDTSFVGKIYHCFEAKGIIALAYWLGSFFAEQIRHEQQSYPFLEIVGDAGAGKSTLIEFLWKLAGRTKHEGIDPSKGTAAGVARSLLQVSNLPVVLMEGDRDSQSHAKKFDYDELKPLFNGRSIRTRGMATAGNETYEPAFKGAVIIAQNATVNASEAVIQRIVHLHFRAAQASKKPVADELAKTNVQTVSGFMVKAITHEKELLKVMFENTKLHEKTLSSHPNIKNVRIALNYAQMMALVDALNTLTPLPTGCKESVHQALIALAVERQQRINQDHPVVEQFFEVYEYLNNSRHFSQVINHSKDESRIAINMNQFVEMAAESRQQIPALIDLKRILPTSTRYKFVASSYVVFSSTKRDATPSSMRCWIFEKPAKSN